MAPCIHSLSPSPSPHQHCITVTGDRRPLPELPRPGAHLRPRDGGAQVLLVHGGLHRQHGERERLKRLRECWCYCNIDTVGREREEERDVYVCLRRVRTGGITAAPFKRHGAPFSPAKHPLLAPPRKQLIFFISGLIMAEKALISDNVSVRQKREERKETTHVSCVASNSGREGGRIVWRMASTAGERGGGPLPWPDRICPPMMDTPHNNRGGTGASSSCFTCS